MAATIPDKSRPDVDEALRDPHLEVSGFSLRVRLDEDVGPKTFAVFAELPEGSFHQLQSSNPQAFTLESASRGAS